MSEKILSYLAGFATPSIVLGVAYYFFPFIIDQIKRRRLAKNLVYDSLDPILKSGGELYGKLHSLAREDFATFTNPTRSISDNVDRNKIYVYFLFCQFWGHLEHFRATSQYHSISKFRDGKFLIKYIEIFESRKFRVLDRADQRIIGENMFSENDEMSIITLTEFLWKLENDDFFRVSVKSLANKLNSTDKTKFRQQILIHGVVVAAMIGYFDNREKIVRRRKIYWNKLTQKSQKTIKYVLVGHYLPNKKSGRRLILNS